MTTVTRLLVSLLVTVVAASVALRLVDDQGLNDNPRTAAGIAVVSDPPAPAVDQDPAFDLSGVDSSIGDVIRTCIGLFDDAGLSLPSIRFVSFDDPAECRGREGMVVDRPEGLELRLCHNEATPTLEWVIIHELAHCWDRHELADDVRRAFVDLRGLPGWREGAWHERGAEHAAEVMVWGLIDRPVRPGHIDQNSCDELTDGYVTLTGREPLHGYCDLCP